MSVVWAGAAGTRDDEGGGPVAVEAAAEPILAFTRYVEADRTQTIWLLNADGSERRLMTGREATWSPNGQRFAFVRTLPRSANALHAVLVHDSRTARTWTRFRGTVEAAQWSPTRELIAIGHMAREYSWLPTIALVPPTLGSAVRRLALDSAGTWAWAPNGRQIAFSACEQVGPGGHMESDCRIVVAAVPGTSRRQVLDNVQAYGPMSWSPDGRALAVQMVLRSGPEEGDIIEDSYGVWVLELDSRTLTRVIDQETYGFDWSPDSRWIAHIDSPEDVDDDGAAEPNAVRLVSRDGRAHKVLIEPSDDIYVDIAWSRQHGLIAARVAKPDLEERWRVIGLRILDPATGTVLHQTSGSDSDAAWRPTAGRAAARSRATQAPLRGRSGSSTSP